MPLIPISPSGVSTAFIYPTQVGGGLGYMAATGATPPNVNPPDIFEPDCDFTGNQAKVVMIVTGPPPNWGGAQIWASADGTTYGQIGTVYAGGVQGVLTATFPSHTDPDTVDTLSVDTTQSGGQVISGSNTDADMGITLAYVDGELVGYSTATLTSPNHYDLGTYLRRGVYGSTISSHASGSKFGLVNGHIFTQIYPVSWVGRTVYFKFLSFNSSGGSIQSLANVVAYSYVLTGAGVCPPRTNCRSFTAGVSTTLNLGTDYQLNVAKSVGSPTTVNGPPLPVPDGTSFKIVDFGNGGQGDCDANPITFQPAGGIQVAGLASLPFTYRGGAFTVTYCKDINQWTVS